MASEQTKSRWRRALPGVLGEVGIQLLVIPVAAALGALANFIWSHH